MDSILPAGEGDYTTDLDRATARAVKAPEPRLMAAKTESPPPDPAAASAELAKRDAALKPAEALVARGPVNFPEPAKRPELHQTDPLQAFGSVASTLGVIGGLLTKHPLTAALNASTAAMKAIRENDLETYDSQIKAWRENAEFAQKRALFEANQYGAAVDLMKSDWAGGASMARALMAKNQVGQAEMVLALGPKGFEDWVTAQKRLAIEMEQANTSAGNLAENIRANKSAEQFREGSPERQAFNDLVKGGMKPAEAFKQIEEDKHRLAGGGKMSVQERAIAAEELRRSEAGEPPMTADDRAAIFLKFKEDAPGVAARKADEVEMKRDRLDAWKRFQDGKGSREEKKIANTEEFRRNYFEEKRLGREDAEAFHAAMEKHWSAQTDVALKRLASTPAGMKADAVRQIIAQQESDRGRDLSGEEKLAIINKSGMPDDQTVTETAKLIANYQLQPMTGYAMRSGYGQAVMSKVSEINPQYSQSRFNEINRAVTAFGTGKQGDTTRSFNVAIAHLQTLDELGQALASGDVKGFNRVSQIFQEQFGQPAPGNFEAAKQIVGDEIIKAIVGSGGGVTERAEAEGKIAAAKSPEQLRSITETYRHLMLGQLNGLRHQYKNATGLDNFDEKLLPETRSALDRSAAASAATPDVPGMAAQAWGTYDPDNYDYRTDPVTGKVQRKPKVK